MTAQTAPSEQDEQEKLRMELAEQELKQLTVDGYMQLKQYIQQLEDNVDFPEAPGIAFCELWGVHGGRINLTSRSITPISALDNLINAVKYAERYGLHPTQQVLPTPVPAVINPPAQVEQTPASQPVALSNEAVPVQAPQPQYVPVSAGAHDAQSYPVASISHEISTNATHYLKVVTQPGTPYGTYGVSAWPEVFPKGFDINTLDSTRPTKKYTPPPEMAYALIGKATDKQGKERNRVFGFSPTP